MSKAGPQAEAVVLLSGGMDSCVCAALAVLDLGADNVAALHVSYSQRTEAREARSFMEVCERLGIGRRMLLRTQVFREIGGSALTDESIAVPEAEEGKKIGDEIPVTYVPFRNA